MILTLQDSTGVIDFKVFEGSRSNLPPVKLNDVLLVRETPVSSSFYFVYSLSSSTSWT